jgi:hypothetical protein
MPAGGFFLLHHVDVVIEEQPVQAIELIGEYDPTADSFTGRAYDNNQGQITIMRARVDEQGVWTFTGGVTTRQWPGPPPPTRAELSGPRCRSAPTGPP